MFIKTKIDKMSFESATQLLLSQLKSYTSYDFIREIIKEINRDILFSFDDKIACIDELLKFVNLHQNECGLKQKIKRVKYIIRLLVKITPYEPFDNMLITKTEGYNIFVDEKHENKRYYYPRRKVSKEFYNIGKEVLYENQDLIYEKLGISIDVYYDILKKLTFYSLTSKENNHCINLNDIPELINHNNIFELLKRESSNTYVKIYQIGEYIYATDFLFFEENAFFILDETLKIKLNKPQATTYNKSKGDYVERIVYDILSTKYKSYLNLYVKDFEIDVVSKFSNILLLIETKATKYDSLMKENVSNLNNCRNEIRKGANQLYERINVLISEICTLYDANHKEIVKTNTDTIYMALLITMDNVFDYAQYTFEESKKSGYKINPVILSLDDFMAIFERCNSDRDFFDFLFNRTKQKQINNFHKDDFYYFMIVNNLFKFPKSIIPNPVTLRQSIYIKNVKERLKLV